MSADRRVTAVVITRNRHDELRACLERLRRGDAADVIVVDNGSDDGSAACAAELGADVVALPRNLGAAGRTIGVARARTPYVAFVDDDSWWGDGAMCRAADILDAHAAVAVVTGRIEVHGAVDPISAEQAASPLGGSASGRTVLGFAACAAMVRRDAYLAAGGFHRRFGVGGEEDLLAIDLAAAGWSLLYCDDVRIGHAPSPRRSPARRRRGVARNALRTLWLRRPAETARRGTLRLVRTASARGDVAALAGLAAGMRDAGWIRRERTVPPVAVEAQLRLLLHSRGEPVTDNTASAAAMEHGTSTSPAAE